MHGKPDVEALKVPLTDSTS